MQATMTGAARGAARPDWYDADWLAKYVEAREIVARVAPERLDAFTRSFDVLRMPPGFRQRVVRGFLSADQLERIRRTIGTIPKDRFLTEEIRSFGRFIVRNWPEFGALQATLADPVSELAGEPVEPSYNFLSLYTKLGVCRPHLDAPSAKWTLDICIDQSEPWPIHFSRVVPWPETADQLRAISPGGIPGDPGLGFEEEVLMPGDAVLFSGTNQWHYRDALPRRPGKSFCDLLFLHYVPVGAADLTQPKAWARLFDIPALAEMTDLDQPY
jgi:hypothetical protein